MCDFFVFVLSYNDTFFNFFSRHAFNSHLTYAKIIADKIIKGWEMNQFNPMSQDNTPRPHQRFFDGAGNNPEQEAPEQGNPDDYAGPLPNNDAAGDMPPAMPQDDAPAPAPTPAPAPAPEANQEYEGYFNETRERLINVRKERNGIILRIDKLQDQKIENGSSDEDYDDDSREIMKLQSELIRKNNLIDALLKVLISLK